MTILELREKRNKAWEAAKAFVETKRDKDGLLSAEDAVTYAEMEQKVQNYSAEIARMEEMGIELDSLKWYCDLRRFGSVKHAGFGLGLERFILYLTNIGNIRDTIPYARTPRNLMF